MKSGIYCFENLADKKKYVGQSKRIKNREKSHLYVLKSKKKKDSMYFQNAWNNYGEKNFKFWIVEKCTIEQLDEKEIYWIKTLHSHVSENGYNISWGGKSPMKNRIHSDKSKKLISENHVGMLGKTHSDETKKAISEANKGRKLSEETCKKMSEARQNPTEETRKNMSITAKNRSPMTEETCKKISVLNLGKKRVNSTSKYRGVCLHTDKYVDGGLKWQSRIRANGNLKRLGCFRKEMDAAKAYNEYIIENNLSNPLNVF